MKTKKGLLILLVSMIGSGLTFAFAIPNTLLNSQEITRPAVAQGLVSATGEKIVEVTEASYQMSENVLKGASCRIKNLGGQDITGMGLIWTVTFMNGEAYQTQSLIDHRLHKDIVDTLAVRPFSPYEEKVITYIERDPHVEGHPIKEVKVEIVFVEFADSNGVGIENSGMHQRLLLRREGAEIYKKWLDEIYGDDPKHINRVVEKLSSDELPDNKKLEDDGVKTGASFYRQWMLGVYQKKGADSLKQLLRRR